MQRRRIRSRGIGEDGARRVFYGCNRYPECDFTSPHQPIAEPCPKCGAPFIVEKRTKLGNLRTCLKEGCDWEAEIEETPEAIPRRPSRLVLARQTYTT